ncbi:MAG: 4-hydroxy-tetrahydrodipicolinate synthase [Lachnospiraceae bacterium]|nr:4-hydroxy-tetrahydrodipicolinate synthase [Lachnospiraceae bacterium]
MSIFTGAGVAVITPMNEDLSVNYEELAKILDDQIAKKTDAIIICGTTGESSTLTLEEHADVIRFACKHVNKRVPVIAGTGSNCTQTAIRLSQDAEKDGADALLIVTPYYNKATQKGLIAHYTQIAESVSLPIIMYNVPSRTGCNILPATAVELAKNVPNIVAIKEASGNISQIMDLAMLADGCIDIYSGNDDQILPLLAIGGKGVISVLSNVAPTQTHEICAKFFEGDVEGARKLQMDALPLIHALFSEVNPIPVKEAMNLLGWNAGPCRMPLSPMDAANKEKLTAAMRNYGLLK